MCVSITVFFSNTALITEQFSRIQPVESLREAAEEIMLGLGPPPFPELYYSQFALQSHSMYKAV